MPTSSQSQILSVVDYQLIQQQQQQTNNQPPTTRPPVRISVNQISVNDSKRRQSIENKNDVDNHFPPPVNVTNRRRSSDKTSDSKIKNHHSFQFIFYLKTNLFEFFPARIRTIRRAQRHFRCTHHNHYYYPFILRGMNNLIARYML